MIGQTVSHYRIIEQLGKGGMGIVYLAEDIVLGRRVAIKTLTDSNGPGNQHFRARFLREARAVSNLSHPHIATIHDYGETTDGQPYIVMELVKGEMLAELMQKEKLTIPRSLKIVREVAEALAEAHRHGIIHRDIKPSNVAIDHRGNVKVLDFGLAKQLDLGPADPADPDRQTLLTTQTREGVIVGTPMYLSPEQALGVDVDARSDLFSLGGVLYECIAGKPPFVGNNPIEICAQVIRDDPRPPSEFNAEVSSELDRITLKALAKKQEQRYQTADDLIADLDHAHATLQGHGSGHTVTRLIAASPATRPTSALATLSDIFKRPRLSVGYVAAGMVLVSLIAFVAWRVTRPRLRPPSPEAQRLYEKGVEAIREGAFFRASKLLQQAVQEDDQFALAHARLAEVWTELDSSDKAKDELIRATDLIPDRSILPKFDSLKFQAVTNTVKREFGKAVDDYQALASSVPETEKGYALLDLGRAYEKFEKSDLAITTYQESTKFNSHQAAAFLRLGVVLGRRSRFGEAYASLDQASKLFDVDSNIEGLVEVLLQRAVVLGLETKINEARAQLVQALEKSTALENQDKRVKILLNLSNTEIIAGNADQAQQYSTQAVELARANGLDNLTMQGMIDIGNAYLNKGNFAEAEKHFNEALRLAELYKGDRSKARALLSLASLRTRQGNLDGARNFFQQALPFYQQGGYRKEVFALYAILGRAEDGAGNYEISRQMFEQLLQQATQAADSQAAGWAQEGLGSVFLNVQNFPEALQHFEEGYRLSKSLNAKVALGYIAVDRASVLWQLGDYDKALADLREALEIAQPPGHEPYEELVAYVHLTNSRLELSRLDLKKAISEGEKALELSNERYKAIAVRAGFTLGLAEALSGQVQAGMKHCEDAVNLARSQSNPAHLSSSLLALAETELISGDAAAALSHALEGQQRFGAAKQNEEQWRALAIAGLAAEKSGDKTKAREFASRAASLLSGLEQQWGHDNYDRYCARSGIKVLQAKLNALLSA